MIQYSTALRRILARPISLGVECVSLDDAPGRVLAQSFAAPESLPRHTYSAMDGFAALHQDLVSATSENPIALELSGESRPGRPYNGPPLQRGQCIAIATGGAIPLGADSIVPVEWTSPLEPGHVAVTLAPGRKDYFRPAGSDVKRGRVILSKGQVLNPAAMAIIAQFGFATVNVMRKPRVGILTSGDELVPVGSSGAGDRIVATNLFYLRHTLTSFACDVRDFGIARDHPGELLQRLSNALDWADLVITCAGVSAGNHDYVVEALNNLEAEILLHGVAVKPGKPALFAVARGKPVFGLPGNPLSAACGIEIFVKPYIRSCLGAAPVLPPRMEAPLTEDVRRDKHRLTFLFARLGWAPDGPVVHPPARQESGNLTLLSDKNCLAEIPPGDADAPAGTLVRLWPLR